MLFIYTTVTKAEIQQRGVFNLVFKDIFIQPGGWKRYCD